MEPTPKETLSATEYKGVFGPRDFNEVARIMRDATEFEHLRRDLPGVFYGYGHTIAFTSNMVLRGIVRRFKTSAMDDWLHVDFQGEKMEALVCGIVRKQDAKFNIEDALRTQKVLHFRLGDFRFSTDRQEKIERKPLKFGARFQVQCFYTKDKSEGDEVVTRRFKTTGKTEYALYAVKGSSSDSYAANKEWKELFRNKTYDYVKSRMGDPKRMLELFQESYYEIRGKVVYKQQTVFGIELLNPKLASLFVGAMYLKTRDGKSHYHCDHVNTLEQNIGKTFLFHAVQLQCDPSRTELLRQPDGRYLIILRLPLVEGGLICDLIGAQEEEEPVVEKLPVVAELPTPPREPSPPPSPPVLPNPPPVQEPEPTVQSQLDWMSEFVPVAEVIEPEPEAEPEAPKALKDFTVQDVVNALTQINLGQYAPAFEQEAVDGEMLTQSDFLEALPDLGVTSKLHMMKIRTWINKALT